MRTEHGTEANWRRLAAAMLKRAALDARSDGEHAAEARRWLARDGMAYAEALGLPPERVESWVAGLEPLPCEQLTFDVMR
jgi:hypothetical protein